MRTNLARCNMLAPRHLGEALQMLSDGGGARRPFAGGTDLMVLLEAGTLPLGDYVNLWGLDELKGIEVNHDSIVIGALAT
jgi:CO/xanthine dehydrogenase FAD-binding subunit